MAGNSGDLVAAGIKAYRSGNRGEARVLFEKALEADERDEDAWLWLSGVVETIDERRTCLENVLIINPDHTRARAGMTSMGFDPDAFLADFNAIEETPPAPVVDEEAFQALKDSSASPFTDTSFASDETFDLDDLLNNKPSGRSGTLSDASIDALFGEYTPDTTSEEARPVTGLTSILGSRADDEVHQAPPPPAVQDDPVPVLDDPFIEFDFTELGADIISPAAQAERVESRPAYRAPDMQAEVPYKASTEPIADEPDALHQEEAEPIGNALISGFDDDVIAEEWTVPTSSTSGIASVPQATPEEYDQWLSDLNIRSAEQSANAPEEAGFDHDFERMFGDPDRFAFDDPDAFVDRNTVEVPSAMEVAESVPEELVDDAQWLGDEDAMPNEVAVVRSGPLVSPGREGFFDEELLASGGFAGTDDDLEAEMARLFPETAADIAPEPEIDFEDAFEAMPSVNVMASRRGAEPELPPAAALAPERPLPTDLVPELVADDEQMTADDYFHLIPSEIKATRIPGATERHPRWMVAALVVMSVLNAGALGLLVTQIVA
jgi:hypothetical protein